MDAGIPVDKSNGFVPFPSHDRGFDHQHNPPAAGRVFEHQHNPPATAAPDAFGGQFDIFEWHPAYLGCQRYFLDHAQYDTSVQAVSALINIALPFQWTPQPVASSSGGSASAPGPSLRPSLYAPQSAPAPRRGSGPAQRVSLIPYIRRLVVTGFDREPVLHGFFGDDWRKAIGPLQECERRNYLFAAKSGGWSNVKSSYDMGPQETVPFLQPPQELQLAEIENANKLWSQWLWLEDWMHAESQ